RGEDPGAEARMTSDEQAVSAATTRFYEAIEAMITGKGLGPMREAWHHGPDVTSGHPSGEWAHGWDEVLATWEVFAGFGDPKHAGSSVRGLTARAYGDVAYTTCTFVASPSFGGDALSCTNVLRRVDGA